MKIQLGTVQFGIPYGVANPSGQVNREEIAEGAEDLGLERDEIIAHVLEALVPVGEELGL